MDRALLRRYERKENAIQEEAERRREVPRQRSAAGAACASRWTGSCARSGVTTPQYSVLSAIAAYPGVSNARLARLAFATPQIVQEMLVNLERYPRTGRVAWPHPSQRPQPGRAGDAERGSPVDGDGRRGVAVRSVRQGRRIHHRRVDRDRRRAGRADGVIKPMRWRPGGRVIVVGCNVRAPLRFEPSGARTTWTAGEEGSTLRRKIFNEGPSRFPPLG